MTTVPFATVEWDERGWWHGNIWLDGRDGIETDGEFIYTPCDGFMTTRIGEGPEVAEAWIRRQCPNAEIQRIDARERDEDEDETPCD